MYVACKSLMWFILCIYFVMMIDRRKTAWQILAREIYRFRHLTEQEAIFCLLLWAGVPRAVAYGVAFPNSKAAPSSISTLAGRIFNSPDARLTFRALALNESNLKFTYPADIQCFIK